MERVSIDKVRFFRVERTYAVKTGKWYFEFEAVTGGDMRVGWARPGCKPDVELGTDELAFVFDGYRVSEPLSLCCGCRESTAQGNGIIKANRCSRICLSSKKIIVDIEARRKDSGQMRLLRSAPSV